MKARLGDTDRAFEPRVWGRARIEGKRILYVDDDPLIRRVAARLLRGAGAACSAAGTHDEAVALLLDVAFDLAILDFQMPDGDVSRLVRRLRLQQPSLRLLGTSGVDCRAEFAARGVGDFLPKPWALDDLIRVADGSEAA